VNTKERARLSERVRSLLKRSDIHFRKSHYSADGGFELDERENERILKLTEVLMAELEWSQVPLNRPPIMKKHETDNTGVRTAAAKLKTSLQRACDDSRKLVEASFGLVESSRQARTEVQQTVERSRSLLDNLASSLKKDKQTLFLLDSDKVAGTSNDGQENK
jgi:hypothetical protein